MTHLKLSNDDFHAKLSYLKDIDPDNELIPKLERGNSALNSIYVSTALQKAIARRNFEQKQAQGKPKAEKKSLSSLEIQLRHAKSSRAELSNSFLLCTNDLHRLNVSKKIIELNHTILQLHDAIEAQEESRKVPDLPVNHEKYPVPTDPLEMYKKQHSLRTSIKRMQKDLERLKLAGASAKVIMDREQKLNHNLIHKAYVDRAIQAAKAV